jgi:hypothetical protein
MGKLMSMFLISCLLLSSCQKPINHNTYSYRIKYVSAKKELPAIATAEKEEWREVQIPDDANGLKLGLWKGLRGFDYYASYVYLPAKSLAVKTFHFLSSKNDVIFNVVGSIAAIAIIYRFFFPLQSNISDTVNSVPAVNRNSEDLSSNPNIATVNSVPAVNKNSETTESLNTRILDELSMLNTNLRLLFTLLKQLTHRAIQHITGTSIEWGAIFPAGKTVAPMENSVGSII